MRIWDYSTSDINKIKKIKVQKPIFEILNVVMNQKKNTLVVYEDGSAESLDSLLESRSDRKIRDDDKPAYVIEGVQFTSGVLSYIKRIKQEQHFCFSAVEEISLKPCEPLRSFNMDRSGQDVTLMGYTVIKGKTEDDYPALITVWSDKRLFKQVLNTTESVITASAFHSIIDVINTKKNLALAPINEDCVAIYACKRGEDGSFVAIYNIKYKVFQSKVPFKVYLNNFKLWSLKRNIFLGMGEQLSVIPYRITTDQLSNMVGSQRDSEVYTLIEKEMLNEDANYEESLEFDDDQEDVEGMEFKIQDEEYFKRFEVPLSKAIPVTGAYEVNSLLNELYREELQVEVVRIDNQPQDTIGVKLLSNVDEAFPILSENFELVISEMEKYGFSEIEITDKVMPILIKANRTEDIGLMLKRYNHVSDQMLVKVLKYLLSCPDENDANAMEVVQSAPTHESDSGFDEGQLKQEKLANANIFLSTIQSERRDVMSIVLCCSFDSATILKHLRRLSLHEMMLLMDHLYSILTTSSLDYPFEIRGNLVEGNDFDLDTKLFEWFTLLIDSHYQQILLCHNAVLHKKLENWLKLIDDHIKILTDMNNFREILAKVASNKSVRLSKKCNQWYSIEKLQLY